MKIFIFITILLIIILQYRLWWHESAHNELYQLKTLVMQQRTQNVDLEKRNTLLAEEVEDLKQGLETIESLARSEFGMIKKGEVFYQIIE